MRKPCFLSILLILVLLAASAAVELRETKEMVIGTNKGKYHSVSIYEAASTDTAGMDFELADSKDPIYTANGRLIGYWDLHSNYYPLTVRISATDLSGVGSSIPYVLQFSYDYPIFDSSGNDTGNNKVGMIYIGSAGYEDGSDSSIKLSYDDDNNVNATTLDAGRQQQGINFDSQQVRFIMPSSSQESVSSAAYGEYTATVTVTIEGVE